MSQHVLESSSRTSSEPAIGSTESLAVMAHELKTPLAIIAGYVDLLLSYRIGSVNERQRQVLEACHRNCESLQNFISNFLIYARQDAGKMETNYVLGDLNKCLADVHESFLLRFLEKGVAFRFEPTPSNPSFRFDYAKTRQATISLVENALKFTPPAGTVTLSVEQYADGHPTPAPGENGSGPSLSIGEHVRVMVADTGPGIDPEDQQRIFEPFVKLPQGEGRAEGAGLGLAIARRLIEAQGGRIRVESSPGAGSRFMIELPLVPPSKLINSAG